MTRAELREDIKLSFGLDAEKEDGNMPDDYFDKGIANAMKIVAKDCKTCMVTKSFPLRQFQYQYPIDDDVDVIRAFWYIDGNGLYRELKYFSPERLIGGFAPSTDLSGTPEAFTYPTMQRAVIHFWAQAPPVYDYISESYVTEGTIRTLVDSGANFGATLSGYRIVPNAVIRNITDGSYGYVQVMSVTTAKATGTAGSTTSTDKLIDTGKDFTSLNVSEGDIICVPSTGMVQTYAFITDVGTTSVDYADARGLRTRIRPSDTYKIGRATEIVLSGSIPHPGLRQGASNSFNVSAVKATIANTIFEVSKVTGVIAGTPETGDNVIADSGQHAVIINVYSTYLTVDKWIGGMPNDSTNCSVKRCDQYQIETKGLKQRVLQIYPTPDSSDTGGSESLIMLYNKVPDIPTDDDDVLEIDERYRPLLIKCAYWQANRLSGVYQTNPQFLEFLENDYKATVPYYESDSFAPPATESLSIWDNMKRVGNDGRRFEGSSSGGVYRNGG